VDPAATISLLTCPARRKTHSPAFIEQNTSISVYPQRKDIMKRWLLVIAGCILILIGISGLLFVRSTAAPATPVPRDAPVYEQLRILAGLPADAPITRETARDALLPQLRGYREAALEAYLTARGFAYTRSHGLDENGAHGMLVLQQCPRLPTPQLPAAARAPGPLTLSIDFVFQEGDGPLKDITVFEHQEDSWGGC
jgi:hypothetical protein